MTIGQFARQAGVSERTLRFYEKLGLLQPKGRTPAGYRYYGQLEVQRLQQIRSLQSIGLPLARIGALLQSESWNSQAVVKAHLKKLDEQIEALQKLRGRLARLDAAMTSGSAPADEDLLRIIEEMSMLEKHISPQEMEKAQQCHQALGDERSQAARQQWGKIVQELGALQGQGKSPTSKELHALSAQGRALLNECTNNEPAIQRNLRGAGPVFFSQLGLDVSQELSDYVVEALRASS